MKKALFSLLAAAIAAAVPVRAIILAALAALLLAAPPARATTGELLTRFGLDDATQYAVTDAAILDGLPAGATAIRVPKGVSVDLAIPQQLKDAPGHPYTLVLKIKITDASSGWVCLANMPDSNDSDAMIYLHKDTRKVCIKQFDKGSVSATSNTAVQKNRWTVLAFAFGAGTTTVYMDGDPIYSGSATLANSFADCYRAGDYILVGADNDGDDNPFFLADARIYDGAVAVADELPGTGIEEDPFRIASVADWELLASNVSRGMALGDDFPYYRLVADIGSAAAPVTRSVGTDAHPFCGDFDGGSNTIRVALSGSASGTAPFARTDGARIHDLKVAGSVSSAANHAAGLVGLCAGQTVLQRCDVAADVAVSGAGYAGGIVGHGGSGHGLTVFDSLYTGTISGFTAHAGGLVGWCDSLSAMYLGDCLFKGSFAGSGSYHPIACRSAGTLFPVYLTGDTVYYPNTVPPTEDVAYIPFEGTPVSETLVPGEWDVPVTAVDGNVYYLPSAIFITPETEGLLLQNGDVLAGTGGPDTHVLVADGATVTLRNVCITNLTADAAHNWGGITCKGDATIVLQGVNYLRGGHPYIPGLFVPPGKTLVIRGDGTLDASSNGDAAGIGGGVGGTLSCGDIVIEGGTIVATGGDGAAGIGAGQTGTCGTITVTGGSVTAIGGNAAAGIGSGQQGTNGTITVSGGIVTATGGAYGAGIGSGYQAVCGDIAVSGGTVAATGGQYAAGIGSGFGGTCGDITLSGGTTAAAGGQYAPGIGSGVTLTSTGFTATCGDIALEEGVVRVTADGGGRAAVGAGYDSTAGAVTVGGVATTVSDTHYVYAPCVLTIATTADWDAFASRVNRGVDSYDGLTVTLAADIAVSTPVGTTSLPFRGTFDGGGHALAVAVEGTGTWTAPFLFIDGATIANLTVTGTVTSGGNHAAGLVGACGPSRPNAIRDCTVAVDVVADGTGYAGGIVGQGGDSTLALAGCVFSGSVRGFSAFAGGLLGWGNTMTLAIDDCLVTGTFAPAGSGKFHPIACKFANRTVAATVSGAYWINAIVPTATGDNLVAGAAGAPVSATLVPGEWESPVAAADGSTYYAWTPAPAGRLLAHLAFDDAGNAGANLLRATVGLDAIVRATPATPVAGIGDIAAVSDAGILSGLPAGDGAVAIPAGQHFAVPIPAPLLPAAGRPYTVVMKIRVPGDEGWRSLLNMPASNDSDAMVYLHRTTRNIYLKQFDKSSGAGIAASNGNVAADRWTTLAFAFGEDATDVYLDGTAVLHGTGALAGSYADCAASGGYILVGADDSGDDSLFYLSDFRIYEGAVAIAGFLPGSGTAADPYLISSVEDWSVFAANVRNGVGSAACYRLAADIGSVAVPAGADGAPFSGTFNGGGHTLTVALSGTDPYVAPFAAISGATISNLVVAGTVGGGMHCSGLVGLVAGGTNTIEDCEIAAAISTARSHFGGIVGHGYVADTTLRGCVFSGSLSGGTYVATFNAWSDGGATTRVIDCLDASASNQPIGRGADAALVTNAYYAASKSFANAERLWSAGNRGKQAYSVTGGEGVTIGFGTPVATYAASGIAAYPTGIARGGVFYAGEGETVSLGLSAATPPPGQALDGFVASAGTLTPDGGAWSLAMSAEDVVVTASFRPIWAGSGTADAPYRIATVADWNALADVLDGGADTAGKHFLLATNLSVTTMLGYGSASPFKGVFDGGGHVLTVALAGTERYVAPFSAISGATISNLVVAGTVGGGMHCAGLVGSVVGGSNTIADCKVVANISSSDSHFGGIVGHGLSAETTLRGCTFSGTLAGGEHVATLFGWADSPTVALVDCLDASESPHPIGRCGGTVSVANTYFLAQKTYGGNSLWSSANRGRQGYSVTAAEGVAIGFGAPVATYGTGGIAAYAPGIAHEDVFYAGMGETVSLSLASTAGGEPTFAVESGVLERDGEGWLLTMPAEDVVVLPEPPVRSAVTLVPDEHARPEDQLSVDGSPTGDFTVLSNATVEARYRTVGLEWTIGSASVVAEGGAVVPCTVEPLDYNRFAVRFTMPGEPVSVTPVVSPAVVRPLQLGENAVSGPGFYVFVAPASATYAFEFGGGNGWRISDIVDEMLQETYTYGDPLVAKFAAGSTHYILVDGPGNGEATTLSIAKTVDLAAYSVTVVPPEHGTLASSVSEAPDGCYVYFTAVPDPGWELVEVSVVDSRGWGQDIFPVQDPFRDGTVWLFEMWTYPVTASATFARKTSLVVGENPVLFEHGMPACSFVAPEDGWYRFRSTNEVALANVEIRDADGNRIDFDVDVGRFGGFDGIARLEAGSRYLLSFDVNDHSVDGTILVGRCTVHAVAADGNAVHGRVAALDMDGNPVVEALEGSRVFLRAEADAGYGFGGWSLVDSTGAAVPVSRDDLNDLWFFRMPGTNVVVSAVFGGPHAVRVRSTAQVRFNGFSTNAQSPDEVFSDRVNAVEGAEIAAYFGICVGWTLPSATVVTALGETVPCTIGRDAFENCALVRFRMPDVDVVVAPLPVRCEGPELHLGDNEIDSEGICRFVAPASGEYSFHLADSSDWDLELFDDLGSLLGTAEPGRDASAILAMGSVLNVRSWQYGFGAATVTVSRVGDAVLYPVSVAPPVGGTVEPSDAEAPEGRDVRFTVAPDPGWRLSGVRATGPNGNESYQVQRLREGLYSVRMPAAPVVFEATFERSRELVVGVNPTLFESSMRPRTFVAPKDGWYRFRTTCGGGLSGMFVRDNNGQLDFDSGRDENGDIDGIVRLSGGSSYYVDVYFYPEDPVEASIVVGFCATHGVESDPDVGHGRIKTMDGDGNPVDEALEGTMVLLDAEPDNGYALAAWNVVDATGAPVPVRRDFDEEITYFRMPGTNVLVSATFSRAYALSLETPGPTYVAEATANEIPVDPNRSVAAAGAEVLANYWVALGWTIQTFVVETPDGAAVPFSMEPDDYGYVLVRFTMPDAAVTVTPVPVRRTGLPELVLGTNAIAAAGVWRFVPPTNGVYSFTLADPQHWHMFFEDDWGYAPEETWGAGNFDVALVQGAACYVEIETRGGGATTLTIERIDDVALHPVVIDAAHATVERLFDAAPAGRTFPFTLVAAPGWTITDVVATDADGTELEMEHRNTQYNFEMPASSVTVTATFAPALPWYLEDADDKVLDNYGAWAARYGADPFGTNLVAFLLDIDPATSLEGKAPLKVTDFRMVGNILRIELGSDVASFDVKPDPGEEETIRLGNGFVELRHGLRLPEDDRWGSRSTSVRPGANGRAVMEIQFHAPNAIPPMEFFRPVITTKDNSPIFF